MAKNKGKWERVDSGKPSRSYTTEEKNKGFAAVQKMSQKCRDFYDYMLTQPGGIEVYGYDTPNGERYAFKARHFHVYDLIEDDLQTCFESLFNIEKDEREKRKQAENSTGTITAYMGAQNIPGSEMYTRRYGIKTEPGKDYVPLALEVETAAARLYADCRKHGIRPKSALVFSVELPAGTLGPAMSREELPEMTFFKHKGNIKPEYITGCYTVSFEEDED